jgi:DNA invertase Pin-like site-specific DNA recombinase
MISQHARLGHAAVYARYSSDLQDTSSIDGQVRKASGWAEKYGFTISERHRFIDEAVSGTKNSRPGLERMLAAAEQGEFDILIVESLSRLARSHVYASTVMMHLVYVLKIRIVGIDDGCDTNNTGWELLAGIKNILNEQYVRDLGKMVRRGHIENIMHGFSAGDLCFGYKSVPVEEIRLRCRNRTPKKRYVIDEAKAVWVKRIFDWYVNENRSLHWIAEELTRLAVPKDHRATTTAWHHSIVHRILSNKKYLGVWTWGQKRSERNPITGNVRYFQCLPEKIAQYTRQFPELRLIDDNLFDKAQDRLNNRRWLQRWNNGEVMKFNRGQIKYLLTGLIKCGVCGEMFQTGGKNSQYLFCHSRRHGTNCKNGTQLPRQLAERMILQELSRKILTNNQWIIAIHGAIRESIQRNMKNIPAKIKFKERAIEDLRKKIERLIDKIEEDAPIPELQQRLEKRTEELRRTELELRELQIRAKRAIPVPNRDWVLSELSNLETLISGTGSIPMANKALKNLLDAPISMIPEPIPGYKRCFLRGTVRLRAGKIAGVLTGIDMESGSNGISNSFIEEFVIDFRDTVYRDERRKKIADLYRDEGWSIKVISEKVGISRRFAAELIKEDYRLKGEKIPDFRVPNRRVPVEKQN